MVGKAGEAMSWRASNASFRTSASFTQCCIIYISISKNEYYSLSISECVEFL
jgi:hypothetical protein